jgi:hypothetical protein
MLSWTANTLPLKPRHSARQYDRLPTALRPPAAAAENALHHDVEAVVLVDHGSKRAEANAMLEQFAEVYRWVVLCASRLESIAFGLWHQ